MRCSYFLKKLLTFIQLLFIVFIFGACTRSMQFASSTEQDAASPGVQCNPDPINAVVPAGVQVRQPFTVSINLSDAVWTFQDGSNVVTAQGSPATITLSPIGTYSATVSGLDNCKNSVQKTFSLDVVNKPITNLSLIINNGATYTNNTNVTLTIAATGATQMYLTNDSTCKSGGTWQTYSTTSPWTLGETNKLTHVYAQFKNTDYIDNHCVSAQITEDDVAPIAKFDSVPKALTNSTLAQFLVSATDNLSGVAGFFCKLDQGNFSSCPAQFEFSNLADGSHSVSVYAVDNAQNKSQSITYSWVVDTVSPVVTITQKPSDPSIDHVSNFSFTVTDSIAIQSTKCAVDGGALQDCLSPVSYNLPNGVHSFVVTATDVAGNSGSANYNWTINDKITTQTIDVTNVNGKADILFVVDNSSSMYNPMTKNLPELFQNFLTDLGKTDYRIGYITADASGTFHAVSHGNLLPILAQSTPWDRGQPESPTRYFIDQTLPHFARDFMATMIRPEVICLNVGSGECIMEGSAYQEGIHSTLEALQNKNNINRFMRNDAALNVVIVSSQDEGTRNLTDSNGDIRPNTPSYNLPQTLISYMQTNYPQKQFRVHGVFPRPQDKYCNRTHRAYIYDDLVKATGGSSASICSFDSADTMDMAKSVASSAVVTYQLKCAPQAGTLTATYNPQPASPIQLVVNGNNLSFNPSPAAGTVVQLQYVCP